MPRAGRLVVYVTSHGFGHLNRTVAVLNRVPREIPITVRCHASLFANWRERLTRPAELEAYVSDAGAVNPPGDSAATDGRATLDLAERVYREAISRIDEEVEHLRRLGATAVLSDAPPVPLLAAKRAWIPGCLLANFTWAEIYAPHARAIGGDAPRFVAELRRAYRSANLVFRAEPALAMRDVAPTLDVGLVVNAGRDRKAELRRRLGVGARERLAYFYVGRYGQADLGWENLAKIAGVHFVGFHPAPVGPIANLHVVPPEEWTGADLAASTDAMVVKAGYGTVCEAMAARTPMIYPPRVGFAEHRVLDRSLRDWGGGVPASSRAFRELRLEPLLRKAFTAEPGPSPFPTDGAKRVADALTALVRGRGLPKGATVR